MKQGRNLVDLASEIERQREAKADFVADTRKLKMVCNGHGPRLEIEGHGDFGVTEHAHRQIGERIGIPAKYYDRMLSEAPDLLERNVNHWFESDPERRMVRTLDGDTRAFLSERFRPMDNHDLAEAVLPALANAGAKVESCEITPSRMYIKGVVESIQVMVPPPAGRRGYGYGNEVVVSPGIVISNSEVGVGALAIQPAVHFLSCTNMAVWAQHALRKYHVGKALADANDDVWQFLSNRSKELSDAALWLQVRDMTVGSLEGNIFDRIVQDLHEARAEAIEGRIVTATVEKLGERKGLVEHERAGVLQHLIEGGDLSKFGLSNAITRYSQDVEGYDRATFLEQLGGEVITLPRTEWDLITA